MTERPEGSHAPVTGDVAGLVARITETGSVPVAPDRAPSRRTRRSRRQLRVDWPSCRAHGLCHELLPELIGLDEWGYPVLLEEDVRSSRIDDARRAAAACPTLALRLVNPPG